MIELRFAARDRRVRQALDHLRTLLATSPRAGVAEIRAGRNNVTRVYLNDRSVALHSRDYGILAVLRSSPDQPSLETEELQLAVSSDESTFLPVYNFLVHGTTDPSAIDLLAERLGSA